MSDDKVVNYCSELFFFCFKTQSHFDDIIYSLVKLNISSEQSLSFLLEHNVLPIKINKTGLPWRGGGISWVLSVGYPLC